MYPHAGDDILSGFLPPAELRGGTAIRISVPTQQRVTVRLYLKLTIDNIWVNKAGWSC